MKSRRSFVRNGLLIVPAFSIFVPKLIRAQTLSPFNVAGLLKPAAGGGGGSCPADGSPDENQATSDNVQHCGLNTDYYYVGQEWSNGSNRDICKTRFYLTAVGTISTKYYTVRIYTKSGSALNTVVSQSDTIAGNNAWSDTANVFTFSNPTLTASTTYCFVLYVSDASGNPASADASNYVRVVYKETGNPLAGSKFSAWDSALALTYAFLDAADAKWSLYYYD